VFEYQLILENFFEKEQSGVALTRE